MGKANNFQGKPEPEEKKNISLASFLTSWNSYSKFLYCDFLMYTHKHLPVLEKTKQPLHLDAFYV